MCLHTQKKGVPGHLHIDRVLSFSLTFCRAKNAMMIIQWANIVVCDRFWSDVGSSLLGRTITRPCFYSDGNENSNGAYFIIHETLLSQIWHDIPKTRYFNSFWWDYVDFSDSHAIFMSKTSQSWPSHWREIGYNCVRFVERCSTDKLPESLIYPGFGII